jgi:hypothetical protein
VDKRYVHNPNLRAEWPKFYNTDNNAHIVIGKENYFLSAEGFLMPAKKGQVPPVALFQAAASVIGHPGAMAAWPLAARAQQPDRMRRVGVLMG